MPFFNSPYRFGNLYIDFQFAFPDKLTNEQSQKIANILNNERLNHVAVYQKMLKNITWIIIMLRKLIRRINGEKKKIGEGKTEMKMMMKKGDIIKLLIAQINEFKMLIIIQSITFKLIKY